MRLVALLLGSLACSAADQPPHIVFTLTDDLGFNFPGFNNQEKALVGLHRLIVYSTRRVYCVPVWCMFRCVSNLV